MPSGLGAFFQHSRELDWDYSFWTQCLFSSIWLSLSTSKQDTLYEPPLENKFSSLQLLLYDDLLIHTFILLIRNPPRPECQFVLEPHIYIPFAFLRHLGIKIISLSFILSALEVLNCLSFDLFVVNCDSRCPKTSCPSSLSILGQVEDLFLWSRAMLVRSGCSNA